jgi:hypothetical protein
MVHECHGCERPATLRCSGCKTPNAWYCGKRCQRELWPNHIFECNPRRPISTAYYLAQACRRDRLPDDLQTCEDYGFTRAFTAKNRSRLLGLYQGLLYQDVSPKTLNGWFVEGTLVEGIKRTFQTLPENNRGGYYPWFLENQWVLDRSKSPPTNPIYDQMMAAWRYAGGSLASSLDEIVSTRNSWPEEKRMCFNLCVNLFAGWHPSPDLDLWRVFGFCVCRDERSESSVARLYNNLFAKCTFDQFYAAYESSTLVSLFRTKGLGSEIRNIPHLEALLNGSMAISVWDLKQYVLATDRTLIPPVMVDYGFVNCKSEEEKMVLKEVYRKFFEPYNADPIKLHKAAIGGRLFEYVGTVVKLKKKFNRLMKNPYPLPDI